MDINRADIRAELTEVFHDYEKAFVDGDNETLAGYFWNGPGLVRFGLADEQHGLAELLAWRLSQPAAPPGRRLYNTVVTTFGTGFAVVATSFDYPDGHPPGRQSQTWLRTEDGWRIVAAHVSRAS